MRIFTIIAMVFLFVFVGMQRVAQGDEVKAKVEEMKGEANAKTENAKGEAKAFPQNTEPESHLGHGVGGFPHQPHGLPLNVLGILTSGSC